MMNFIYMYVIWCLQRASISYVYAVPGANVSQTKCQKTMCNPMSYFSNTMEGKYECARVNNAWKKSCLWLFIWESDVNRIPFEQNKVQCHSMGKRSQ